MEAINTHSVACLSDASYLRVHQASEYPMRAIQGYSTAACQVVNLLQRGQLDTNFGQRGGGKGTRGTVMQSPGRAPPISSRGHIPNPCRRHQEFLPDITC